MHPARLHLLRRRTDVRTCGASSASFSLCVSAILLSGACIARASSSCKREAARRARTVNVARRFCLPCCMYPHAAPSHPVAAGGGARSTLILDVPVPNVPCVCVCACTTYDDALGPSQTSMLRLLMCYSHLTLPTEPRQPATTLDCHVS